MIPKYVKVQEAFASTFFLNYLKIRNSEKKWGVYAKECLI